MSETSRCAQCRALLIDDNYCYKTNDPSTRFCNYECIDKYEAGVWGSIEKQGLFIKDPQGRWVYIGEMQDLNIVIK